MDPYETRVLADSISPGGVRLTTLLACFPRFILAEFNTHRTFSRCSASSRAVPVAKRIAAVRANPFVPEAFGRNRRGMSAAEDLDDVATASAREVWMAQARLACAAAEALSEFGVHKQLANRVLEPFLFHEVVVSATDWDNFWHLRVSAHAQPEMRRTAESMLSAYEGSLPTPLDSGAWHLPFVEAEDADWAADAAAGALPGPAWDLLARLSVARCARVSYLTHDGRRDRLEDLRLCADLLSNGHMSPFEHAARVLDQGSYSGSHGNFRAPWVQYRKTIPGEADRLRPERA